MKHRLRAGEHLLEGEIAISIRVELTEDRADALLGEGGGQGGVETCCVGGRLVQWLLGQGCMVTVGSEGVPRWAGVRRRSGWRAG